MNSIKTKVLDEIMAHIRSSQGNDLKSAWDKSRMPPKPMMSEMGDKDIDDMGKPKGLSVEKISVMEKPGMHKGNPLAGGKEDMGEDIPEELKLGDHGDDEEMSDDELKELLSKYME